RLLSQRRVAGEHEDQAERLLARVSADAAKSSHARRYIGNALDRAGRVVSPGVIAALDLLAADAPLAQRELPVRAAILEREDLARVGPDEHDRLACKRHRERLAALQLSRLGDGIPVVGIARDAAQVRPAAPVVRRALSRHSEAIVTQG